MFLSVFDIFKVGIGPSSSHTMGPMVAAERFLNDLRAGVDRIPGAGELHSISVTLYGSLAFTGKGHATDRAVILGLCGYTPQNLDPDKAEDIEKQVYEKGFIEPEGLGKLIFHPKSNLTFYYGKPLEGHANGMIIRAHDENGNNYYMQTYYSVGGGFILTEDELKGRDLPKKNKAPKEDEIPFPYPFNTAKDMLKMGQNSNSSIAKMKRANEMKRHGSALDEKIDHILDTMDQVVDRGLAQEGILPGGLNVKRRAKSIHEKLLAEKGNNFSNPHQINDWMSVYAIAVNEENAAGGRVVTSPTNGAAGVIPAVLRYYRDHCIGATRERQRDFLLVAAAIGGLIKHNASISGAEVGCQGEVGSAAAMAAAGLCAALGGTNEQIENAAEIALEHHLGMTCDPAAGLVQVPCIERNALGAIKAVSAASLAMRGDGSHFMPLDNCIEVMLQTGRDMNLKYKETSTGGIAVNLPEC